jgi:hypothetical protein
MHSYKYKDFEGTIPSGRYGAGRVKKHEEGQVLVTSATPTAIHFTVAHRRYPERFVLVKPPAWKDKSWLLINKTPVKQLPYEKVRYKKIPAANVEKYIAQMQKGDTLEAKIDGASNLIRLMKDGVEMVSYRASKETGRPILYTERVLHGLPKLNIPDELVGTVLKGELYGAQRGTGSGGLQAGAEAGGISPGVLRVPADRYDGAEPGSNIQHPGGATGGNDAGGIRPDSRGVIPPQELGGLLNSSIAKSIADQRARNIKLKNMVYDIQQLGKKHVDWQTTNRLERRKMIEQVLQHLPADTFHISPAATDPQSAQALWQQIQSGEHPMTEEGVVMWPHEGPPLKSKLVDDYDVHITGTYPGEGKYRDAGIGGFTYALEPGGPTVGRVGTGLSDQLRSEAYLDPEVYAGRVARIRSQEQHPSGAYRAPSFLAFHEEYPTALQPTEAKYAQSRLQEEQITGISSMVEYEDPMPEQELKQIPILRCERDNDMRKLAEQLSGVLEGYGTETDPETFTGAGGCERELLSGELCMGGQRHTEEKHAEQCHSDVQQSDDVYNSMGRDNRYKLEDDTQPIEVGMECRANTNGEAGFRKKSVLAEPYLGVTLGDLVELGIVKDPYEKLAEELECLLETHTSEEH